MNKQSTIALIGNPNVGKTVIFNALTNSRAHVANWPGVTVEKRTGKMGSIEITDLPGVYSLTPNAVDDLIARKYIIDEQPELIVDILDATNLERNLYLGLLLKEMGLPVLFVLNMWDNVQEQQIQINLKRLEELLHSPILTTAAIKNEGIEELKQMIHQFMYTKTRITQETIYYSIKVEEKIQQIITILTKAQLPIKNYQKRWFAIKILENDAIVLERLQNMPIGQNILSKTKLIHSDDDVIALASERYSLIQRFIEETLVHPKTFNPSEFLDHFFLDRKLGLPLFFMIMWALFELTFRVATPLMTLIEIILGSLGNGLLSWLGKSIWTSLLVDGIINGFGSIIIFLPNIFLMFLGLSFLEDSGYLSRAAFVMDRLMYKLGLHGRSFVSMLLGFGCNVPAIMSTRAIESEKDRITTIMANQNMSCGARLPVYILIGGAVWGVRATNVIFALYAIGILIAILVALTFKKLVFKGERTPFILELGSYRNPTLKYTLMHMYERGKEFVKKAGTIIFLVVVGMWILQTFPLNQSDPTESWLYAIGTFFQPLFKPLNFGVIAVIGIIFGFLAKEVVVAAFGLMLGVGEEAENLGEMIFEQLGNNPVIAFSYLIFVLLYTPCVAVIGAIKRETGSWKWPLISVIYGFILAYIGAFLVQLLGGVYF